MRFVYDLIYLLALLVGWPLLVYRRLTRGPGSLNLSERLGNIPSRPVSAHCVWLHGVSLGEINATRTLVAELRQKSPETAIVLSSTTNTGLARARELYAARHLVFRFPLDFSPILSRTMARVRPSVIVLMELEAWPNLLEVAGVHGVVVIIANGRVTETRSMRNFRRPVLRAVARRMFSKLRWVGAQETIYARRFAELGVHPERIEITGSMKYDAAEIGDRIEGQEELSKQMGIDRRRPLWVCGSTGPGEEALLLDAYQRVLASQPDLQIAIVPRKPERFDEVAELIVSRGFACLRRSTGSPTVPAGAAEPRPVFLGDTMGELRKFYALASVVFVGRTLVPMGGSDLMEAAGLARPVLFGPHVENFAEAAELLIDAGGAEQAGSAEQLVRAVVALLQDPNRAGEMGRRGREAIVSRRGATERTAARIIELLHEN